MKIAFTVCSNNYLAQAKILGDSLLENNPEYKMIIGLCDKMIDQVDYSSFKNIDIIPVSEIGIYCFDDIINKYDIVELNTSIKPSFFKFLINKFKDLETIMYFDPDIQIFNNLKSIEKHLFIDDVLLTPHILRPLGVDNLSPSENLFLNYGIYNLGFLAVNPKSQNVLEFLDWWEEKTLKIGYSRVAEGLFVDQLWINLVPIFFKKVRVLMEYGFNVAPWNLHERNTIYKEGEEFIMVDRSKLVFYHFSNYNYKNPALLSKYYDRYTSVLLSEYIEELYSQYHLKLMKNKVEFYSKLKCGYIKVKEIKPIVKNKYPKSFLRALLPPILFKLFK